MKISTQKCLSGSWKALAFVLCLLTGGGLASAVNFINKDQQWHYKFTAKGPGSYYSYGKYVMQFGADTIVDGKTYTK